MYRLSLPGESDSPAALFLSEDGAHGALFYFQVRSIWNQALPRLRLEGLDRTARYRVSSADDGEGGGVVYSGSTLMGTGLQFLLTGDYNSTITFIDRV